MIKFYTSFNSDKAKEYSHIAGERAQELLERVVLDFLGVEELPEDTLEYFHIIVNDKLLDPLLLKDVEILSTDSVTIKPAIRGGDFGQIFKQIAIIVIAIVAAVAFPPSAGLSAAASAAVVAGITIGATLILNALIPPPNAGGPGLGGANGFDSSQMYSIGGQSNQPKPFGNVPRVYGVHRLFPNVAANPYTTVEVDPNNGELVQYFNGLYDFGFGPAIVSELRIGDTPIELFDGVEYRFVDFHRPEVSEGDWDDLLGNELTLYRGVSQKDGTIIVLNKNKSPTTPVAEYRAIRNAATNSLNDAQEITLDFVFPQGLVAFSADGKRRTRTVELRVEFSKVGEENWKNFDDLDFVDNYRMAGGTERAEFIPVVAPPVSIFPVNLASYDSVTVSTSSGSSNTTTVARQIGFAKGRTNIILAPGIILGNSIRLNETGQIIGRVVSVIETLPTGEVRYALESPLPRFIPYFSSLTTTTVDRKGNTVDTITSYWPAGTFSQTPPGKLFAVAASNTRQVYATLTFSPKEIASYKVRVTRENSFSSATFQIQDAMTIFSLWTRFDRQPVVTDKRHVFLELRIKATNQLNGNISNLSGIVASVLDVYDPIEGEWVKELSSNPAWVFADLLTGEISPRPISKDRLETSSLVEWAEYCDEVPSGGPSIFIDPRYSCNFILDYQTTLQQVINQVTNSAQASLNIVDGKYGVLLDINRTIPVQVFTPRNSWGFTSSRAYSIPPNAIKVRYISPGDGWISLEALVYDDGFDEISAETFDELSSFACTGYEQAWRFGRYMMAQARLRKETISINVDFEYLVCTRGDYVQVTQDVMKAGGRPARVKTVTGATITIDDDLETITGLDYAYVYRNHEEGIRTSTLTVVNSDTFVVDGDIPEVGDLIVIGEAGKVVLDCIVKAIMPNNDLSAELILVEKAEAIYSSELGVPIPDYDPQLSTGTSGQSAPNPVADLEVVENTWRVIGREYQHYITLDWEAPEGSAVAIYEIYVDDGRGFNLIDSTKDIGYEYLVNREFLDIEHEFKVLGVSATGEKISLVDAESVFATPETKRTRPSDVPFLAMNITGEMLQLEWGSIPDPDLDEYLIRYSPLLDDSLVGWNTTVPLTRVDRNTLSTTVSARAGTYLIKAVDFNGNESENVARAITSIPELFNLNIIEEVDDFPLLNGEKELVVKEIESLILRTFTPGGPETNQYYPEGFYYYENFLDLGEIYTVRLQSLIQAEGFTVADLMVFWDPLSEVLALAGAGSDEWDVEAQVRYTDAFNVMAEWVTLDTVDPLSEGVQDLFSPWTKFIMGDFTARIFQFRLKLISRVPSVTPRVLGGLIKADMPDRVFSLNDIVSNAGATLVEYDPPFKGPNNTPNIQITQDDAQLGDYFIITDKTLSNFTITFYDSTNTPVSRRFDVSAKGYGRKAEFVI